MLTAAQYQALKANIAASEFAAFAHTNDNEWLIAAAYNVAAAPAFIVWKTLVPIGQVGQAFNGTELAGLTANNLTRLQTLAIYLSSGVNPSLASVRGFFDDVWSGAGGVNTRAALLALWKRAASRAEKLFATGTGTDADPATLSFEGALSWQDIELAWNTP